MYYIILLSQKLFQFSDAYNIGSGLGFAVGKDKKSGNVYIMYASKLGFQASISTFPFQNLLNSQVV